MALDVKVGRRVRMKVEGVRGEVEDVGEERVGVLGRRGSGVSVFGGVDVPVEVEEVEGVRKIVENWVTTSCTPSLHISIYFLRYLTQPSFPTLAPTPRPTPTSPSIPAPTALNAASKHSPLPLKKATANSSSPSSPTPNTPIFLKKPTAFQSAGSLTPGSLNVPTNPCTNPLIAPSTSAFTSATTLTSGNLNARAAA